MTASEIMSTGATIRGLVGNLTAARPKKLSASYGVSAQRLLLLFDPSENQEL